MTVRCTGYRGMSDCSLAILEREFPLMFGDNRNLLWPSRPTNFRNSSTNLAERSLVLSWEPPLDSSIRDVRGFFITIHGVDGLASGLHQCIVIQLNQSLSTTHYKTEFSVTFHPLFESSIYDFWISSLPKIDLNFSSAEGTMGNLIRIKIGKTTDENSPADWTTPVVCQSDGTSITAVFRWPPRRFMMSLMDVTILQLFENRSHFRNNSTRIVLSEDQYGQLHKLQWNYSSLLEPVDQRIMIMISPVDMVKGLGQCVCYNADFLCVGVCKQSSCELVIEHPTQESAGQSGSSYSKDFKEGDPDPDSKTLLPDHIVAICISLALLAISVTSGITLFFLRKHVKFRSHQQNLTESDMHPNNQKASETLTSPEVVLNLGHSRHHPDVSRSPDCSDPFIKPSPELDEASLTLSEQMLQINENYLNTVRRTGSQMSLFAEKISLGGKSV